MPGDRILIAYESTDFGYFEDDIRGDLHSGAVSLGLDVSMVELGFSPVAPALPSSLTDQLDQFDVVVFLARLGDQLRFSELPKGPRFVVCFTFNSHLIGSAFGTANYNAFLEIKSAVDACFLNAESIKLSCPAGTSIEGKIKPETKLLEDTTSKRFPMSVFSPVPAARFSGKVALAGFLTGTGSQYYDDYTLEFSSQVFAHLENGRLAGFSGKASDVKKANTHYDRVSERFGLKRNFVHSWHAGIHPGCGFPWDIRQNFERWGGAAFGNPRVLHFHTCGTYAPGEISWNLLDPTIEVDGKKLWENGTFDPTLLPGGSEILDRYPCAARAFANPDRNIGFDHTTEPAEPILC